MPRDHPIEPMIHATMRGVTRVYQAASRCTRWVRSIWISRAGEFFAVVGPSGCGKSTLLDVLAGLNAPTEGSIRFEDKPWRGQVPDGVGVVFQEDASFPWLTVRDNVAFGLRRAGMAAAEIARRVEYADRFHGIARISPTPIRRSFPAACASGSASPARWCCSRG